MQLYSTNNKAHIVSFQEALFNGLPADQGLYAPTQLPRLSPNFIKSLPDFTFQDISFQVAKALLEDDIPDKALESIVNEAINFPAPVIDLGDNQGVLELFHGPSLAFKDFGARFMARTMSYFNQDNDRELVILVATSGDTGGAVAAGFHKTPGIRVIILYPSGKVSHLQEKQLTTLGDNITALEIKGTFDDCQKLVKQAFLDHDLTAKSRLSSANSINIARLIPQSFYYFEAYKQVQEHRSNIIFTVPSGNFGNLTAGVFAQTMGLPVHRFIAATNANNVVPTYLETGVYTPAPAISTLSNAMDVGAPSNFARMLDLYCSTWNNMTDAISGYSWGDEDTKKAMIEINKKYNYIMDPHGAVGYLSSKAHQDSVENGAYYVNLETAHPAKFLPDVADILGKEINIPERLSILSSLEKHSTQLGTSFDDFKAWLMTNL